MRKLVVFHDRSVWDGPTTMEELRQQSGMFVERKKASKQKLRTTTQPVEEAMTVKKRVRACKKVSDWDIAVARAYDQGTPPKLLREQFEGVTQIRLKAALRRAGVEQKPRGYFSRSSSSSPPILSK